MESIEIKQKKQEENPVFEEIARFEGHKNYIYCIAELYDYNIATSSCDIIKIWDHQTKECILTIDECNYEDYVYIRCIIEFEPNYLLYGTSQDDIILYNLSKQFKSYNYQCHTRAINCLLKLSSHYFASGSNDNSIIIWNYHTKTIRKRLRGYNGEGGDINSIILLKDERMCFCGENYQIKIFDWIKNSYDLVICNPHNNTSINCLLQLDDYRLISGGSDKCLNIYNINKLKPNQKIVLHKHEDRIFTICKISEYIIASGDFNGKIKIWNLKTRECIQNIGENNKCICPIYLSIKGNIFCCNRSQDLIILKNKTKAKVE